MLYHAADLDVKDRVLRGLRVAPEHRVNEADLAVKTWFEYQVLDPVQRTYLFAEHYREQTRRFYEKCIDIGSAEDARAFTPSDIFMSRDMTSMWLARRASDELGVPYSFTMAFAQARALDRHFHRFPRPNQLYGEEFEDDLKALWMQRMSESLQYSQSPSVGAAQAEKGRAHALRHASFVVEQIRRRPAPRFRILGRMFKEGVLSARLECVRCGFSEQEIEQADDYVAFFG